MVKRFLINYANEAFKESQKVNTQTGKEVGGFDKVVEYSPKDIDKKFYERNKHILTQLRGGGYWLWKPYIILKTLQRKDIKNGDFIFYADSGSYFINKIDYLTILCKKYNQDVLPFSTKSGAKEKIWTKRDSFILMNLGGEKYENSPQYGTGFILIRKSSFSIRFFKEFLKYAQDERVITDSPSKLGIECNGFKENRHDQSVFSLLSKKYHLKFFRQPWQIGNSEINLFEDKYPQILVSTRKNNRTFIEKIKYQKACSKNRRDFITKLVFLPMNYLFNKVNKVK
jgi:hypothetical protein